MENCSRMIHKNSVSLKAKDVLNRLFINGKFLSFNTIPKHDCNMLLRNIPALQSLQILKYAELQLRPTFPIQCHNYCIFVLQCFIPRELNVFWAATKKSLGSIQFHRCFPPYQKGLEVTAALTQMNNCLLKTTETQHTIFQKTV